MSRNRVRPPAGLLVGIRSRLSASTLAAYDAASAATTAAGPVTATSTPPRAGPAILVAEVASPYSAFALPS
jgi:hypothetical protein